MKKKSLILGAAIAGTLSSGVAMADVTGNIGMGTNYVWRGMTQTADQAAIYGGLDWSDKSGLYVGTWVSNVQFPSQELDPATPDFEVDFGTGYELDFYVGFSGESGDIGYDVGLVTYAYPVTPNFNFTELYLSGSFSIVTVSLNLTVDEASGNTGGVFAEDDLYISVSADVTDNISVYAGSYSFDAPGADVADYSHIGVSISKDDFTFTIDKNDADDPAAFDATTDNMRVTVSWGKEFEL